MRKGGAGRRHSALVPGKPAETPREWHPHPPSFPGTPLGVPLPAAAALDCGCERQYFPSLAHLLAICVCPKVSERRKRGGLFVVWEYAHIFLYKLMVMASLLYAILA